MRNEHIASARERLDLATDAADLANSYIAVRVVKNEVVLSANAIGMALLAKQLLQLAQSATNGAHYHLDTASLLDDGEYAVVFTRLNGLAPN